MSRTHDVCRQWPSTRGLARSAATGLATLVLAGAAVAGESHPRAELAQGRISHERVSPDLWPEHAATAMEPGAVATDRAAAPLRIEVHVEQADAALVERVRRHAAVVHSVSSRHRRITLEVADRAAAVAIADLPGVVAVERAWGPVRQAGSVTSRAPEALRVDAIAPGLLLDGTGRKLGILSDSFARTAAIRTADTEPEAGVRADNGPIILTRLANQDSSDLPGEVELFADDATGDVIDEGAAMGELAYDIAPAMDIAFHTAFVSQSDFADGFATLCSPDGAAADVVVDDVLYPTEPMYQPGIVAQAASACVDQGVAVFSAAGNAAGNGFRETYRDVDPLRDSRFGDDFHDWGGGDGTLTIDADADGSFLAVLQWNQPWTTLKPEGTERAPQVDLDLYILDGADPATADIVESSFRDQRADNPSSGFDPYEVVRFDAPAAGTYHLAVDHFAGNKGAIPQDDDTPLEFRLVFIGANGVEIDGAATLPGPDTDTNPTLYGHAAAEGVIAVGAVPWWTTPTFDPTAADSPTDGIDPQIFTARGGELPLTFDGDSRFIGRTLPLTPQMAAVDANRNTFFGQPDAPTSQDGADNDDFFFFGTSAAAPNAAAVGILLNQYAGDLSPAALTRVLTDTAVDVAGQRAVTGPDAVSGAGLIDAAATLDRFPVAIAGRDRTITAGANVTLDAGDSSGGQQTLAAFAWNQIDGPDVNLADADSEQARFTAPSDIGTEVAFELRVTDDAGDDDTDRVRLTVVEARADADSSSSQSGNSGCFIATAAYGTAAATEIDVLRDFRDRYLAATLPGRLFIAAYYRLSPPLADRLREHPRARAAVRVALQPLIVAAAHPVATSGFLLLVVVAACRLRRTPTSPPRRPVSRPVRGA